MTTHKRMGKPSGKIDLTNWDLPDLDEKIDAAIEALHQAPLQGVREILQLIFLGEPDEYLRVTPHIAETLAVEFRVLFQDDDDTLKWSFSYADLVREDLQILDLEDAGTRECFRNLARGLKALSDHITETVDEAEKSAA